MKKLYRFTVFFIFSATLCISMTGCGASGTSFDENVSEPVTNLSTAVVAIGTMMNFVKATLDTCISLDKNTIKCACPSGGSVTIMETGDDSGTFLFANCEDSGEQIFTGELSYDQNDSTFNFTQAGICTNVSGEADLEACDGSLTAACGSSNQACDFEKESSGSCLCL